MSLRQSRAVRRHFCLWFDHICVSSAVMALGSVSMSSSLSVDPQCLHVHSGRCLRLLSLSVSCCLLHFVASCVFLPSLPLFEVETRDFLIFFKPVGFTVVTSSLQTRGNRTRSPAFRPVMEPFVASVCGTSHDLLCSFTVFLYISGVLLDQNEALVSVCVKLTEIKMIIKSNDAHVCPSL